MREEALNGAIQLREDFEEAMAAMQAVVNKLNQFIDGEISEVEYIEWCEENDEMFEEAEF